MKSPLELDNTLEDVACFFYVLKGTNQTIDSSGSNTTKKHEGLLKSCGNFISRYIEDNQGEDFEAIVIYFYPDLIKEIYKNELPNFIETHHKAVSPKKIVTNNMIEKFINGMILYFDNAEMMDEDLARLKIKELIMILLKSDYFDSVVDFFKGMFSPKSSSLRLFVENNLFNNLSEEQLAFLCHKSVSSFKREFKREYNNTPAKYIKGKRLEEAAKRLIISEDAMSNIAFDLGFQDASTFTASFSEKFGISPSKYRLIKV